MNTIPQVNISECKQSSLYTVGQDHKNDHAAETLQGFISNQWESQDCSVTFRNFCQNIKKKRTVGYKVACQRNGKYTKMNIYLVHYNFKHQKHSAMSRMDNHPGPLYSTGNSAQCYVAAWMGGKFGGE